MPKLKTKEGNPNNIGKMVDNTQADDKKIIQLVKERKLLYARNNMPVACFFVQVKNLWEEVAAEMGWSVAVVRRKWSHIRNSYSRHLRNEMHSARTSRGRMVSRWYLADELDFLKEHMATDVRTSYPPSFLKMDLGENEFMEQSEIFEQGLWKVPPTHPDNSDDSSNSFSADENASYFQFFRSIHNDYTELVPKKQRLFRRQCLSFLHNLLDQEDNNTNVVTEDVFIKEEREELVEQVLPN